MSDFKIDEGALVAYADGELNAANASAVEEAILKDPELGLKVKAFQASGQLLKEVFGVSSEVIPDHLVHRMREIEKQAAQESQKKTFDLDKSVESTWNPFSFLASLFGSNIAGFSFRSGVISGSLLSGAACAVLVISLGVVQPNNIGFSEIKAKADVIDWRGPINDIVSGYAIQNGLQIKSGGTIKANESFVLVLQSSISGKYQIFEQTDGAESEIKGFAGTMKKGSVVTTKGLIAKDQETLKVGIKISNEDVTITRIFTYDVSGS